MTSRRLALLLAATVMGCVGGCEDRYGTYITVRATTKDQAFDTLDLYFGARVADEVPTTPKVKQIDPTVEGVSMKRLIAPSDHRELGAKESTFTVWLPDGGQNDNLGDYLLAIGSVNGKPVAAGELFDFTVTADREVWFYDLDLHAYDEASFEAWGRPEPDCLRYERDRGPDLPRTIAIVRAGDTDCDTFPNRSDDAVADCEPMLYCDGSGGGDCVGRDVCVHETSACSVGECINADGRSQSCDTEICVADDLCRACDLSAPMAELLDCVLTDPGTHPGEDMLVPVMGSGALCRDPIQIAITLPFPCTKPAVASVAYAQMGPPFEFKISESGSPNVCTLEIKALTPGARFTAVPHILVTLGDPPSFAFVLGLKADAPGACPPIGEIPRDYMPRVGNCPVPLF